MFVPPYSSWQTDRQSQFIYSKLDTLSSFCTGNRRLCCRFRRLVQTPCPVMKHGLTLVSQHCRKKVEKFKSPRPVNCTSFLPTGCDDVRCQAVSNPDVALMPRRKRKQYRSHGLHLLWKTLNSLLAQVFVS